MNPDPPRLIDAGLPCAPLLRQYRQQTASHPDANPDPAAWARLTTRLHARRPWRAALVGGLVVATLALCLAGRGGGGVAAGGGSEGASGSAPGSGGMGGTPWVRRS
jgi:hypothetical protein